MSAMSNHLTDSTVTQLLPEQGRRGLRELLDKFGDAPTSRPFNPDILAFCADFSRALGRQTRQLPELQALAFWMRRSEIVRLAESFGLLENEQTLLVPRGTVFHVPPANVDTVFVYSWLLATLTGNRNVVRLSSRTTTQSELLLDIIRETLDAHPAVRDTTLMIRYGHEKEATNTLSAACDLRVVWGGDVSVDSVRTSPLPSHAVELTFPDRASLAAVSADAYEATTDSERDRVVRDFFNDTYWFDQLGCSSPRAIVWVGGAERCTAVSRDFFARLRDEVARNGYDVDTAGSISKLGFTLRSIIDQPVTSLATYDNTLAVMSVPRFPVLHDDFSGGGVLFQHRVTDLVDIVDHIDRRAQTLTQHGFEPHELRELALALNGRGIDRIVSFGQALTFDRVWDGYDLLQSFTRRVVIGTRSWSA